jgi:hypothetical protein
MQCSKWRSRHWGRRSRWIGWGGLLACGGLAEDGRVPGSLPANGCVSPELVLGSVDVRDQAGLEALRGCDTIHGDLTIYPFADADLRPLGSLLTVTGAFTLGDPYLERPTPAFPSLAGLETLAQVGSLALLGVSAPGLEPLAGLGGFSGVLIADCPQLKSLSGLTFPSELGNVTIANTPLTSLRALRTVRALGVLSLDTTGLHQLDDLEGLREIEHLNLSHNPVLVQLSGLSSLSKLLGVEISSNPQLTGIPDLDGLYRLDSFSVTDNATLQRIGRMPRLIAVDEARIQNNPALQVIAAFATIRDASSIQIDHNPRLAELDLSSLEEVSRELRVAYNPELDGARMTPSLNTRAGAVIIGGNRGDTLGLDPCPWSGDGICVGPPFEQLCALGADSDCR